jgi:hypothetical protein
MPSLQSPIPKFDIQRLMEDCEGIPSPNFKPHRLPYQGCNFQRVPLPSSATCTCPEAKAQRGDVLMICAERISSFHKDSRISTVKNKPFLCGKPLFVKEAPLRPKTVFPGLCFSTGRLRGDVDMNELVKRKEVPRLQTSVFSRLQLFEKGTGP